MARIVNIDYKSDKSSRAVILLSANIEIPFLMLRKEITDFKSVTHQSLFLKQ